MKCLRLSVCMLFAFVLVTSFTGCPAAGPAPVVTKIFDGIEFVWIPAGLFTMGSPATEVGHSVDETQHQVRISHGFWLGKYEVTQAQWIAVMGSNPSFLINAVHPVEEVSWLDAQIFIATLNASKAGFGGPYRLPTESEWEYAYRARTTARFYWGDDPPTETDITDYAWYFLNSVGVSQNVGEKLPNAWGLYDMAGNVWEWCQDWHADYPAGPVTDPQGPGSGTERVIRGGSCNHSSGHCRAARRDNFDPDDGSLVIGFRLARTAD